VSAGSFIVACIRKSDDELRAANIPSAARQHQIPEEWASYYLREELARANRKSGGSRGKGNR